MNNKRVPLLTALLVFVASGLMGLDPDDKAPASDLPAGHSSHGEAFNEGPRQKAHLMGGTGKVDFPVSTKNPQAQEFFSQGVGQLHGFWYFEAERSFRQVAALDSDCAMAYWGMAMANFGNEERARGFITEAVRRKDMGDQKEQLWIEAVSDLLNEDRGDQKKRRRQFLRDIENIIHEYPDDIEAKAFLAVFAWKFKGDLPIPSYEAMDALLAQVFAVEPTHPAHHYKIHLWDREKPERALSSAAQSGQSSPSIAHQWHMAGHIFSRLKRYADAAWQQEASARVDHRQMTRDRVLPDQISNFAHNNEWLTRNLSHIGRVRDGIDLAKNMIELPRHPEYNTLAKSGRSASYGRTRLFELLETYELWDDLIDLSDSIYLEPTVVPEAQLRRMRALARAYFAKGDLKGVKTQIRGLREQLKAKREERKEARKKAVAEAREKNLPPEGVHKARLEAIDEFASEIESMKDGLKEMRGYRDLLLQANDFGMKRLAEVDGLSNTSLARLYLRVEEEGRAEQLARAAVEASPQQVVPLANYVYVLEQIGKTEQATENFEKLREISAWVDLDTPPFERLAPTARRLGLAVDWRVDSETPDDVGERPPLDSLGPFRWSPPAAPPWKLPNAHNQTISLEDYRGKAVIVIFYLGYGCLHCVEQIVKFAPETKRFEDAGISLVAISTEGTESVARSLKAFEKDQEGIDGPLPIPLLANSSLDVFKAYRAYDDFEEQPLHGTFLVNGVGKVIWQDVNYEPFTDTEFLFAEAGRLLKKPPTLSARP